MSWNTQPFCLLYRCPFYKRIFDLFFYYQFWYFICTWCTYFVSEQRWKIERKIWIHQESGVAELSLYMILVIVAWYITWHFDMYLSRIYSAQLYTIYHLYWILSRFNIIIFFCCSMNFMVLVKRKFQLWPKHFSLFQGRCLICTE